MHLRPSPGGHLANSTSQQAWGFTTHLGCVTTGSAATGLITQIKSSQKHLCSCRAWVDHCLLRGVECTVSSCPPRLHAEPILDQGEDLSIPTFRYPRWGGSQSQDPKGGVHEEPRQIIHSQALRLEGTRLGPGEGVGLPCGLTQVLTAAVSSLQ